MTFTIRYLDISIPEDQENEIATVKLTALPSYTVGDEIYLARHQDNTGLWQVMRVLHFVNPELNVYNLEVSIKRKI